MAKTPLKPLPCVVCRSPIRVELEAMREAGHSWQNIENRARSLGYPMKYETIKRHHDKCLGQAPRRRPTVRSTAKPMTPEVVAKVVAAGPPAGSRDFATLVHARAVQLMEDEGLKVSVRDGLAARQILDRREEKAEDRKFMVNLARLLSGGGAMAPVALIEEGTYKDVTPAEELAAGSLLAPAHLRED